MSETNFVRLHPDDIKAIAEHLSGVVLKSVPKPEPKSNPDVELVNLKRLSEIIGVSYSMLSKKKLPWHRAKGKSYNKINGKKVRGRKMYNVGEVLDTLKKG